MLNPSEYFFSDLKGRIRTKCSRDGVMLREALSSYLRSVGGKEMNRCFMCVRPYIELAINRKSFS